jgi:hypothetical protein
MVRALLLLALGTGCGGSSRTAAKAKLVDPDSPVAGTLIVRFEGPSPLSGTLRTEHAGQLFLASVEVVSPRAAARPGETAIRNYESETGPDVFSPFPERWPRKNAFGVREQGTADAVLIGDRGGRLDCRFSLSSVDEGFRGTVVGKCTDEQGEVYLVDVR